MAYEKSNGHVTDVMWPREIRS